MSHPLLTVLVVVLFFAAVAAMFFSIYGGSYVQTRVFVAQESAFTEESAGEGNLLDDYTLLEGHCLAIREDCAQGACDEDFRVCLANDARDPANCEFVYGVYASCLSDCAFGDDEDRLVCEEACFDKAEPPYRLTACFDGCGHNPRECLLAAHAL